MTIVRVSAGEALALMREQGFVYIDVRSREEVDSGLPAEAYNVPLQHVTSAGNVDNPDFMTVMRAAFALDQKLLIGCASGVRSLRAAQLLIDAGYTQVVEQRAGFNGVKDAFGRNIEPGWRALGLPIDDEVEVERSYGVLSQLKKAT